MIILKYLIKRGVLKIAEVVSRIENKQQFIRDIESIGFKLVSENKNKVTKFNSFFIIKIIINHLNK